MIEAKNMTATEVLEAEKAWAEHSAKQAGSDFEPTIDEMLRILREHGFITINGQPAR